MISEMAVMWIGTVALITTFGGVAVSVNRYQQGESSLLGLIAYGFALMFWILFTLHSTQFVRSLGSGVVQTASEPSMMVVGIIGTLLSIVLLFDGAMRSIR